MRFNVSAAALLAALFSPSVAFGAPLYSEDFEVDPTASWTTNNNGLGTNAADFFFDYSTLGISSAPNSAGGTTLGLKLGANLSSATAPTSASQIPGLSVSPNGQSFTGDYELKFDWWHNYFGPLNTTGTGTTMFSTYGILTSGTSANYVGASDSVFFGATGDGGAVADFRIFSPESPEGYLAPDPTGHATYPAGSRNSSAALYQSTFPGGIAAPSVQQTNYTSQTGTTLSGNTGFAWHDVRIRKVGALVSWRVDGVLLGQVDTANFITPTAGTNILFGQSDINNTTNSSANYATLQFTLIDNVRVEQLQLPTNGFQGYYAPANWTTNNSNGHGALVITSAAPDSITIVGPNDGSNLPGRIDYSIVVPASGSFSFDWLYSSTDSPSFDAGFYINNNFVFLSDTSGQSGHVIVPVNSGDTIGWSVQSSDSILGPGVLAISNFSAPVPEPASAMLALAAMGLLATTWRKMPIYA